MMCGTYSYPELVDSGDGEEFGGADSTVTSPLWSAGRTRHVIAVVEDNVRYDFLWARAHDLVVRFENLLGHLRGGDHQGLHGGEVHEHQRPVFL